jgi:Sec-independent protein translocase protein TatA
MRQSFVIAVMSVLVVPLVTLGGCSSDEPDSGSTPTPTGISAAQWAESVCASVGELKTAVGSVTDELSVELGSGDAAEQVKTQLRADAAEVGTSADDVVSAIGEAPDSEEAQDLRDTLQDAAGEVTSATQDAKGAAEAAADATTGAEFLAAAGTALTEASTALSVTQAFATTVKSAASDAGDTLRSAFADADSCASLTSTA